MGVSENLVVPRDLAVRLQERAPAPGKISSASPDGGKVHRTSTPLPLAGGWKGNGLGAEWVSRRAFLYCYHALTVLVAPISAPF